MSIRIQYFNNAMYMVITDSNANGVSVTVYPSMIPDAKNGKGYRHIRFNYGDGKYTWCGFGVHYAPTRECHSTYVMWDAIRKSWYESDSDFSIFANVCSEHSGAILPF